MEATRIHKPFGKAPQDTTYPEAYKTGDGKYRDASQAIQPAERWALNVNPVQPVAPPFKNLKSAGG